jgi:hypothetical protein
MNEYFNCVERGNKGRCFHGVYHRYSQPMLQLRVDTDDDRLVMLVEQIGDEWKNGLGLQRDLNTTHESTAMSNEQYLSFQHNAAATMTYLRSSSSGKQTTQSFSTSTSSSRVQPPIPLQRPNSQPLPPIPPRPPKQRSSAHESSPNLNNSTAFPNISTSQKSMPTAKPSVPLIRPSSISLKRYAITYDYPLTVFLSFAIFCALESNRLS